MYSKIHSALYIALLYTFKRLLKENFKQKNSNTDITSLQQK